MKLRRLRRRLGKGLYWIIECLVLLCYFPFAVLFGPFVLAHQRAFRSVPRYRRWLFQRKVSLLYIGKVYNEWASGRDKRIDMRIADLSRLDEELAGVQIREMYYPIPDPIDDFSEEIEYISVWRV